ncbi:origin recognition complex, subunit 6 [Podospora appendiculata]|uniref:Origin recognition complex, subunit 6 n=1 Tax=Podospora appendiculata TaxID=314037 RepID=A0AAE0X2B8_9PEZI|nr:origin recognition complex, subunit 6 [Podospora appendiculata]
MNRSIEQALLSLLPTHNSTLPPSLSELASSLLAQSRHRASTLKAEEEVARPYACAHIACDRLKITLNLPPIDPRPPIQPRIYKRLYNHLDHILPSSSSSTPARGTPSRGTPSRATPGTGRIIKTPSKLRNDDVGSSPSGKRIAGRTTPGKVKSLAQFRGTPVATPKAKAASSFDALPPWMRPTLRFLCKELGNARIGPVVMSGVESIVAPKGKITDDAWVRDNLTSLLGAVYFYVWKAVTWLGAAVDQAEYVRFRKGLLSAMKKARDAVKVKRGDSLDVPEGEDDGEDAWEGWRKISVKDLDIATLRINQQGWLELDWAKGIDDLVAQADEEEPASDDGSDAANNNTEPLQVRRADTMFQERYDYLSERKRKDYAVWKEGILKRIKELERDTPPDQHRVGEDHDAMDIDDDN